MFKAGGLSKVMRCIVMVGLVAGSSLVQAEVINITPVELKKLGDEGVRIIDIRTAGEWDQTGIIPGSNLMTFFDERGQYDEVSWNVMLNKLVKPEGKVILVCRTGNRSAVLARMLEQQNPKRKIYNLKDGIVRWIKDGHPVAKK